MIRTVVVDDEPYALKRICRLIGVLDSEFQIVATAMDGEEALDILEKTPCDLVFTDIRMPIMDGVELLQRLKEKYPNVMPVVVSGYSDFQYVTAALRAQAVDYLLKPVDEQDMKNLLERLRHLHGESEAHNLEAALARQINRISPVSVKTNSADKQIANLHMMLFCAGALPECENADMCPGSDYWNDLHFGARAKECLQDMVRFTCEFTGDFGAERIVFVQSQLQNGVPVAQRLHRMLPERNRICVSCVCHKKPIRLDEVGNMLRALRDCLENGVRIGHGDMLLLDSETTLPQLTSEDMRNAQKLLSGENKAFGRTFAQSLESRGIRQKQMLDLFSRALRSVGEHNSITAENLRERENLLRESFSAALSIAELCDDISGLCVRRNTQDIREDGDADFANRIADYLEKNYEQYITNQMLSTMFGYVPSYLSAVFRRAKGVSPVEYLTQVRMERAKQLLIECPNMLIKDIACGVGYKNQYHFSRTFKKYMNCWPTDYRSGGAK